MNLLKRSDVVSKEEPVLNEIIIGNGSGEILVEGGFQKERTIKVHYYRPENFTPETKVVYVVPGAGRNGDDYRDAWIAKADEYNLLVLSPEYSEKNYPGFWSYNLAGMVTDIQMNKERTEAINFKTSEKPKEWIYDDFDRIFNLVKDVLDLSNNSYDMFGHSAGGQVLHRLAIFKPYSKADRILASNSGWYTIPVDNQEFPYGLKGSRITSKDIDFSSNLILFLGEKDDANETRGDLRHSPDIDIQGLYRLQRGKYFYSRAKAIATELETDFNWKLEIVPGVGHDYQAMGNAAADYLYSKKKDEKLNSVGFTNFNTK
ncbi:hypothetical protein [Maribacter aestuarii]|uniref:hypothetical protein n=1 Tax=Maribacter aestuarii TaxID=1130723 RepID=UPI0025A5F385|nr:hypothetical protein [Maribacter aestuarii]